MGPGYGVERACVDEAFADGTDFLSLALTLGIKTALRRLHVNVGHPTNDDLMRCLAAGGGTRVAQRAVKCMRCSTCENPGRRRTLQRERDYFVDLCDVVDVRGYRCWWLVASAHRLCCNCAMSQPR